MTHFADQVLDIQIGFGRITKAVGKQKEEAVRSFYNCHSGVADALFYLLNPQKVFNIGKKSFEKDVIGKRKGQAFTDFFDLLAYLSSKSGLTDGDIGDVQYAIASLPAEDMRSFVRDFLCKSITLGVTAKTVNKALGFEFIPEFRCMLANKYFEHQDVVEGKTFCLTEKLDGIRCLAIVKNNSVHLFSRQGQPIYGLSAVEADLAYIRSRIGKDVVFDGELLVADRDNIPSKEQYKRTTMIVRRDGEKSGVNYNVFDVLDLDAFEQRKCNTAYYRRRQMLDTYCSVPTQAVVPLPVLYMGWDTNVILRHLEIQRILQHEGVMINLADEPYQFTRTNALLKVKVMQDCDIRICGVIEGQGKFAGTLGALTCVYKGSLVCVGSGLTDTFRNWVWEDPNRVIGRVATIQYFEETQDKNGKPSLRFPVFKELREIGKEVSYA